MMQQQYDTATPLNNPLIQLISEPRYRWLRHTLFIILGLVLAFKGEVGVEKDIRSPQMIQAMLWLDVITFIFIMGMIYLLLLVLIPKLLFGSRVFLFAISFFIILTLIYLLVWYLNVHILQPLDTGEFMVPRIEFTLIAFIQIGAVTTVLLGSVVGLAVFKKWINDLTRMNDLQALQLRTELEQLKSQVNPHFLFNTFNNLFVLMRTDTDKAAQVLLGLSDLLRYQLYESSSETVLLTKDLDFLHNLLALENIRKNDFEYSIKTEGIIEGVRIPPFLFIAFVENAIKHGASTIGHTWLKVRLNSTPGQLFFFAENSKPVVSKAVPGGLGLANIRRRLQLIYPGTHELEIFDQSDSYIVKLTIPI